MSKRKNVLVILCDQLRPDFLPVYGCQALPCPSIDSLANRGKVFDRAITCCPVCAPARAAMMTGHYPSRSGVWTNDIPFNEGLEFLPERMKRLGYKTACFGKLHHCPPTDTKGFEHARLLEERRLGQEEPYWQWLKKQLPEEPDFNNFGQFDRKDLVFNLDDDLHMDNWVASETVSYINDTSADDSLFMWVSFQGPHDPLNPPKSAKGTVDTSLLPKPLQRIEGELCPIHHYRSTWHPVPDTVEGIMKERTAYAERTVNIDRQIGRILHALEEQGILEETTILFSADHGDLRGDFNLKEKGPFAYSGQLNIPLIVANHPQFAPGTRSDILANNIDIPATVLEIAGDEDPVIGMSRSLVNADQTDTWRTYNFVEVADTMRIVETEQFRFATYPFINFNELFDRIDDPCEQYNLAGRPEYREVEMKLMQRVHDFALLNKGLEIGGFDLIPEVQDCIRELEPHFDRPGRFKAAFPLMPSAKKNLKQAGIEPYTNWYKDHKILAHYGLDFT